MTGYTIRFTPLQQRKGPRLAGGPSSARIADNGEFRLLYNPREPGAVIARHEVTFEDEFGLEQAVPEDYAQRDVTKDGDNYFEFNF